MSYLPVTATAMRDRVRPHLPDEFSVVELGDQLWINDKDDKAAPVFRRPARDLFDELGVGRYETIDANGNASILADLNLPLDPHPGQFDLVTDVGTAEHIWDICQCWRTMHSLCKPNGIVFFIKQTQGWPNHGFYNTQRCFFDDLVAANGEWIYIKEVTDKRGKWFHGAYHVTAPEFVTPQQGRYKPTLKIAC